MEYERWIHKKFDIDYPITDLSIALNRLSSTAEKIKNLINGLPEIKLKEKPNGKWSIKEHIGHLSDVEELHDGRIDDFKNKIFNLRAADMENHKTEKADHNKTSVKDLLSSFTSNRNYLIVRLKGLTDAELARSATHPRLNKQMNPVGMAFFVADHDDHHLMLMEHFINGTKQTSSPDS